MTPEPGQWRINTQTHRRRKEAFQLIKRAGNHQWLARYDSGRNFHLGSKYVERDTMQVVVCDCEKRPIAEDDYVCWACRVRLNVE